MTALDHPSPTRGPVDTAAGTVGTTGGDPGRDPGHDLGDDLGHDPGLVAAWRDLAASARHVNPFQGPDLLLPALRHLDDSRDGRSVHLWTHPGAEPGSLALVLPVAAGRRYRRLPWPVTTGWQHTHHFLGTPLVSPDLGVDGWRAALDGLAHQTTDPWLVLPGLDADVAADVEAAATRDRRGARRLADVVRPVSHRHATDDYLELALSGSRRKEQRRLFRRLAEAVGGGLTLVELVGAGRTEEAVEAFLRLEAAGWKGADGGAMARDPAQRAWFEESCREAAARGGLEVLALEGADGSLVAMAVDLLAGAGPGPEGAVRFTFKIAYDEQHAAWSPGFLLVQEQLHHFHASGAALLDTCAAPDHPMASRLHADRRRLVTLAVGLRGRRGAAVVATAPRVLDAAEHGRALAHDVRRRLADRRRPTETETSTDTTPPGGNRS